MRQPRPQESVQPGSSQRAADRDDHHRHAISYQREQRPRTGSHQSPAQAEDGSPAAYRMPSPMLLGGIVIGWPSMVFTRSRLISATETAAIPIADAMISYIRGDWKRNISWMRNQESTSDLVRVIPKATPSRRYASHVTADRPRARGGWITFVAVVGIVDMAAQKIRGRIKWVASRPPAKKPATATNEGSCRSARPEIA